MKDFINFIYCALHTFLVSEISYINCKLRRFVTGDRFNPRRLIISEVLVFLFMHVRKGRNYVSQMISHSNVYTQSITGPYNYIHSCIAYAPTAMHSCSCVVQL
jgi:hypothetical protein